MRSLSVRSFSVPALKEQDVELDQMREPKSEFVPAIIETKVEEGESPFLKWFDGASDAIRKRVTTTSSSFRNIAKKAMEMPRRAMRMREEKID